MTLFVIFNPYHFVRTILSMPFCPIPFCLYTILSIPFCPYHFVRYHFVLEPHPCFNSNIHLYIYPCITACIYIYSFIHSFILAISIAPLQVLYYSEALPTTARILY